MLKRIINILSNLANYVIYLIARKERHYIKLKPLFVSWFLTYNCQKNCIYCDLKKSRLNKKELPLGLIKRTITELAELGIIGVSLTGGEVLLHKDLLVILKYFKKNNILVNINTNGLLLKRKWKIIKNYVYSIRIGISALNDSETQVLLEHLKKCKKELIRPRIIIRKTLTANNLHEVFSINTKYKNYADKIYYQPVQKAFSKRDNFRLSNNLAINNNDLATILYKKNTKQSIKYNKTFLKTYLNYALNDIKLKCNSGIYNFSIDPYGQIYNCTHYKHFLGKITRQISINNIYKQNKNYRQKLFNQKNNKCQCFTNDRALDIIFR